MKEVYIKQTFKMLSNLAVDMIRVNGFDKAKNDIRMISEVCEKISKSYELDNTLHEKFAMSVLNKLLYEDEFIITWD